MYNVVLLQKPDGSDEFTNAELVMKREKGDHPESGEPLNGKWVLRQRSDQKFLDCDRYRTDLAERHGIKLEYVVIESEEGTPK